ncbi:MAG: hypothetical protein HY727_12425 [Candidatus Rokubacteria bacterium]|nr:hypothetical protein [Candidatus Rokubacteria bacterium]
MQVTTIAAWSIFVLLGGSFILVATNNAVVCWREFVLKQESPSVVPLIGGILGYVGLSASPLEVISDHAWLALVLDVGCGPFLLLGLTLILAGAMEHESIQPAP